MSGVEIRRGTVSVGGIRLFYLESPSDAPAMLCLHGRWGRAETWTELMEQYGGRFRIIAPDQRGHGLSEKPEAGYAAEDFARDAVGLLESLDCGPAVVVGHSMGARIAGYVAALHPEWVRAVAILDESPGGTSLFADSAEADDPEDDGLTAKWPAPYPTYEAAVAHLRGRFERETNVRYFLHSLYETERGYDFLFSRRAMTDIGRSYDPWVHVLGRIGCPALLVRAAQSWCMSETEAAEMRAALPDCTYLEISGSDHMVYADNPDEFYAGFEAFVGRFA